MPATAGTSPVEDKFQYTFTVFTPTFNRAHTLSGVYESLCNQTFRDFEWLVVDDGSSDGTRRLVEGWQREASFPIRYIYQASQGKHIASNRGADEARGELFLTLDSDDTCSANALERLNYHWSSITGADRERFSAVTSLCSDTEGKVIGTPFPRSPLDSDSLETHFRYKVRGEKWGFQRTDVMRRFRFPVSEGQRYIPEGVVWNAIARHYKTRYVNEALRTVHSTPVSLSRGPAPGYHASGNVLVSEDLLTSGVDWFRYAPIEFVLAAIRYARFSFHVGRGPAEQGRRLTNVVGRMLWGITLPLGYLAFLDDKLLLSRKVRGLVRRVRA